MSAPRSDSLAELLANSRATPHLYPQSWSFQKKLIELVESQRGDRNACVHVRQSRVSVNRKKYALDALLFNLCFYPHAIDKYTMLEVTCGVENCVNPLHLQLKTQRRKRTEHDASATYDVTEAALRRLYPTTPADVRDARDDKRARIKSDTS